MSARRVALGLLALGLIGVAGCGGFAPRDAREEESARESGGGEYVTSVQSEAASTAEAAPATDSTGSGGGAYLSRDTLVAVPRPEPSPWDAHEWAIAPATPQRVMLATLELPPGQAFRPPATTCQDVILFVRAGQLEATGTGIATSDAPATLYAGDAVRFGPEGDGLAVNAGTTRVRTVMAIARRAGTGPARAPGPRGDACVVAASHSDPLVRPLRIGSIATTPPLRAPGGRMEIRILLDADGAGAEHGALSWLEGPPDVSVPEHRHAEAAEILLFEDGEGTMRVGDREITVGPGVAIYVPEGTLHSFRSGGTRPLRAIQIYAPAGPEQRFRGM
ncbi:cupin domain-containing protein [Sandaracinus amylolyticus]|uniref:cupin domain-containing protein n=1 Tax=Sandaracinus amylolyticus TaxID=927083 RepID=UPI001F330160|nr:cupin domain-containing protein [Sandaracinus amylolyticus]